MIAMLVREDPQGTRAIGHCLPFADGSTGARRHFDWEESNDAENSRRLDDSGLGLVGCRVARR